MARRILVPVDGSGLAERAVPWADELAVALSADLELLEVVAPTGEHGAQVAGQAVTTASLDRARELVRPTTQVETAALHGSPADVIVARAEAVHATLIAMGSHGRSGLGRAALGSVASEVMRHSIVPVLIVSASATAQPAVPGRVLVPLDESEHARRVFEWLSPLARELDSTFVLCSVADLPRQALPIQGAAIPIPTGKLHTPVEMSTYLEEVAADLGAEGFAAEIQVAVGDPATAIGRLATEAGAGLIAMSTHGRHGLARWVLGSIAEAVMQRAPVPVMVLHPEAAQQARPGVAPAQ